jgi:hypothetical protein
MRRTGFMLTLLASAVLSVVPPTVEQLMAQTTRERVITEEKVITHQSTSQPSIPPGFTVTEPPPPLREDLRATQPSPTAVWVPGYWTWNNGWQWTAGHWEQPPQQRTAWVPGQWVQQGPNWVWRPGYWQE